MTAASARPPAASPDLHWLLVGSTSAYLSRDVRCAVPCRAVLCSCRAVQVRRYAAELVCVLAHLHDHGVVYVDLKPENVLLQDCGHIMLCDMDLAHTQTEIEHIRELEAGASTGVELCWLAG